MLNESSISNYGYDYHANSVKFLSTKDNMSIFGQDHVLLSVRIDRNDITKKHEEKIQAIVYYDPLIHLPNQLLVKQAAEKLL